MEINKISVVAHRGGAALKTENSLQAFANAVRLGVDEVECDVHMMADGKIVVFHDFSLQQLTGEVGEIGNIDDMRRQNLRLHGCNEAPPLLEELARLLAPAACRLHLEIKAGGNPVREREISVKSLAILHAHGLMNRVSAISFAPPCLASFVEAGVICGPCIDRPDEYLKADWMQIFSSFRAAGYREVSLNGGHTSPEFVRALKHAGFVVGVWTINGPARLNYWLKQPVDYITTDQPDLALALRDRY